MDSVEVDIGDRVKKGYRLRGGHRHYTWNINITKIGDYPLPLIEPLPINVCVYYGNDFRTYKKMQLNDYSQEVTSICNMQSQPIKKYQLVIRYGTLYNYGRLVF